jgi:hypothetical protein
MMASIYLSYRPSDLDAIAGRLHDQLVERFGQDAVVWRDPGVGDPSAPGPDLLRDVKVVVALVGPRWLNAGAEGSESPLMRSNDPVRLDLETALRRKLPIFLVLTSSATLPQAPYLPPSLQPLAMLSSVTLRNDPDFRRDAAQLVELLGKYVAPLAAARSAQRMSRPMFAFIGALAVLVVALSLAAVVYAERAGLGSISRTSILKTPTPTLVVPHTPTPVTEFKDPLTSNVNYGGEGIWLSNVRNTCTYVSGVGFEVVGDSKPNFSTICSGSSITQASDERVTITTNLIKDSNPYALYGFYVRAADTNGSGGYTFYITPVGVWFLVENNTSQTTLAEGKASAIHTGQGAINTLTFDAYGPTLTIWVNGIKLKQVTNSDYTTGLDGLAVEHGATVVYTNLLIQFYQ